MRHVVALESEPRADCAGLVRFVPRSDETLVLIGEPVEKEVDVGLATRKGQEVGVKVFSGCSILNAGEATDRTEVVSRLLSPLAVGEIGAIRCIGLNVCILYTKRSVCSLQLQYTQHAREVKMDAPKVPALFMSAATTAATGKLY